MSAYDVFICHKSDQKPWVLVLARNLKTAGFSVFLDEWCVIPGYSIPESLFEGLQNSRKGIVVVTPKVMESGWVKIEYDRMISRRNNEKDYTLISVILSAEIPRVPFLDDISWIDFRDPGKYRDAFYQLYCALRDKAPGAENTLGIELEIPEPAPPPPPERGTGERAFIKDVFEQFHQRRAILLLVQEDRWQAGIDAELQAFSVDRFGETNVRRIVPPFGAHENLENYFSLIADQSGFDKGIRSAGQLRAAIEHTLANGETLFLLLSGFENNCEQGRLELAGVLRGLNEKYPQTFKVLICGGEKLADMYYSGILSYLNHAGIMEWPDFTTEDVGRLAGHKKDPVSIDAAAAQKLLQLSGGHPLILDMGIDLYGRNKDFTVEDLEAEAMQSPQAWQLFTPFMRVDANMRQELCELLSREDVAPAQPYIFDPLLKRLYWKNLLRRSVNRNRLYWRCDILRKVGLRILGNR
ncbi:MAG: toll/interleukin-1 receptor domain-containing protein [Candidatus Aminicenantes bacterium]|nr:toll/interleukin-1 receptor domain-containing protein [Candidatus Aminicenantes bacterium]